MNYVLKQDKLSDEKLITYDLFEKLNKTLTLTKQKIDEYPKLWEKAKKSIK